MCWPQPAQVTLPHFSQPAGEHMVVSFFLLLAEQSGEEAWFLWVILVTLALLGLWNSAHNLADVLSTAAPSCFAAFTAGYFLAH